MSNAICLTALIVTDFVDSSSTFDAFRSLCYDFARKPPGAVNAFCSKPSSAS